MTDNTFEITLKSGRKWIVRPLPSHFFVYFGELPTDLMNQAAEAIKAGSKAQFEKQIEDTLSPEDTRKILLFTREAVNRFCVNPRITLNPQGKNEISPFDITEDDFAELAARAMQSAGGLAEGLKSFRSKPGKTTAHRARGTQLRKTAK